MVTPEAVLQVAQIGVLVAIFTRLGALGAHLENLKKRVNRLEEKADVAIFDRG